MGAILDALHRLQKIERDLGSFRSREESFRRQVRNAQRQISQNNAEYEAHRQAVTNCQMEIDAADLDVKTREESMGKHRQALNAAKTNKEYAAILTALNTEKADASKCESRILELMAKKEELLAESKQYEEARARIEVRLQKQEKKLADYLEETKTARETLESSRKEASEELPPTALQTFNRVAEKHEGEAMAEVEKYDIRSEEHLCGGCNMSIPLEHVNRLRGADELLLCSSCGRILYLDESKVESV